MRQEPPKSCPRAVQEATHRRLGAKTRHKAAPDSLQTSILDHFGDHLEGFWIAKTASLQDWKTAAKLQNNHLQKCKVARLQDCKTAAKLQESWKLLGNLMKP